MELNDMLDQKLTSEEKMRLKRDNGKFKLLRNLGFIPVIIAIFGIYLDSIFVVFLGVILIIAFLVFLTYFGSIKVGVYEKLIIPYVLGTKFEKIELQSLENYLKEEYVSSRLDENSNILKCSNSFKITEEKYSIECCKVISKVENIEEEDGVKDKVIEEKFSGVFACIKLPVKFNQEFRVIEKEDQNDKNNTELIKMNNIEFDSSYDVYSMDQISIRNIISPGTMARVLDINKKMNKMLKFSIYDNKLYIAVNYNEFLKFKSNENEYVNEEVANENLEILEQISYFARYMINGIERNN